MLLLLSTPCILDINQPLHTAGKNPSTAYHDNYNLENEPESEDHVGPTEGTYSHVSHKMLTHRTHGLVLRRSGCLHTGSGTWGGDQC